MSARRGGQPRLRRIVPLVLLCSVLAQGCREEGPTDLALEQIETGRVIVRAVVDRPVVTRSESFAVSIAVDANVAALQGSLSWDPQDLEYLGQMGEPGGMALLGSLDEARGHARLAAINTNGFGARAATFVFRSMRSGPPPAVRFEPELLLNPASESLDWVWSERLEVGQRRSIPFSVGTWTPMEWAKWVDPTIEAESASRPARVPGSGMIWGDAFVSGTINVLDVAHIVNMVVGNQELILDSDSPDRDAAVAGNVRPANSPGLGGAGDTCPPGIEVCGGFDRILNVLDGLAIALEAVGTDQIVVGEAIPRPIATGTATLSGTILGTRTLSSDTVYALQGTVRVGDESTGVGELVIPPGTRLEGAAGSSLAISRNGRLLARGSFLLPIDFTCSGGGTPGCWDGLSIHGNATLNGAGSGSPAIAGRSSGGCAQAGSVPQMWGGCSDADSSGVLEWVRVQGAGVSFLGVGSGTQVEQLYVAQSGGDGVRFDGGTASAKRVRITGVAGVPLSWDSGWRGLTQFVAIQRTGTSVDPAVVGSNSSTNPLATPRSWPTFRNLSVIGPPDQAAAENDASTIQLVSGTSATFVSSLVYGQPDSATYVLDIDDAETWAQLDAGTIRFDSSLVSGFARVGALDPDPVTAAGYLSPDAEGQFLRDLTRFNRIVVAFDTVDATLRGPWASVPDLRPIPTAPHWQPACPSLLADPFFEPAAYCGAVAPPFNTPGEVPWLEPGPLVPLQQVPLTPEPAYLSYLVDSPQLGRLPGVTISGPTFGVTGLDGVYRSYTAPTGYLVTLGNLPPECTDPGQLILLPLSERQIAFTGITLDCPG